MEMNIREAGRFKSSEILIGVFGVIIVIESVGVTKDVWQNVWVEEGEGRIILI